MYLRKRRSERGPRQVELAKTINKTDMYISNIENGKNKPPPDKKDLDALGKILDLSNDELTIFYEVATEDRNTLPPEIIKYIR